MVNLPTFEDLSDDQFSTIIEAFRPYDTASDKDAEVEFLSWLRAKVLAEVQRRLYIKLHSGMGEQEQEIIARTSVALPDLHAPVDITEGVEQ